MQSRKAQGHEMDDQVLAFTALPSLFLPSPSSPSPPLLYCRRRHKLLILFLVCSLQFLRDPRPRIHSRNGNQFPRKVTAPAPGRYQDFSHHEREAILLHFQEEEGSQSFRLRLRRRREAAAAAAAGLLRAAPAGRAAGLPLRRRRRAREGRGGLFSSSSSGAPRAPANSHYRNDFRDAGGLENQSVQELEGYAAYKAEETTRRAQGCVRIAEEMRDTASKTLVTVHQQGQQIHRTHMMALDIDQDLSRSEKLLGDLGGLFSKKWKPKKNGAIRGPMLTRDDSFIRKGSHLEQRQKLGLVDHPPRSNVREFHSESTSALEKVEMEKAKQDDALSDLSNILTELKGMAVDMGSEIERQTKAMGDAEKDYDELNFRVKGANTRARRLLGR